MKTTVLSITEKTDDKVANSHGDADNGADVKTDDGRRTGANLGTVDLPAIFDTPFRPDLIRKAFIHLKSHSFQRQGRHPTAGMDVVADTNDPPTGRGISRVARARGGGGRRRGQGAEVASTRGGRQAHPPVAEKRIYKKLNKKEGRLAFCSAIAATASESLVRSRGHNIAAYVDGNGEFPIVVRDDIVRYNTTQKVISALDILGLTADVDRLRSRKAGRTGKSSLRGRSRKVGKSVLFVTHERGALHSAVGSLPGADAKQVSELSVLDLAPGSEPIRLTIFTESAIKQLGTIQSTHLQVVLEGVTQ